MVKTIRFPNGEELCVLGQGTWNMGRNPLKQKSEMEALLTGLDLGMRMIDTAEMYANESFIGKVLSSRRHEAFLVSKVHPDNASLEGTIKACQKSLKKLGTDYIDLYLLHWRGHHHISQTVEAMCRLQREGKIRLWGVSNLDVDDMEAIEELPNGCSCDANQVLYNLSERGVEYDLIPYAQENGIPVIAYSPISEGLLARHPVLHTIAERHNATPAQIALAWTIRMSGVMAIPKAATAGHVRENFNSLSIILDSEDMAMLDIAFPPPTNKIPLAGW